MRVPVREENTNARRLPGEGAARLGPLPHGAVRRRGDAPQAAFVSRRDPPDASGASGYR
jgi:hypothetical protein